MEQALPASSGVIVNLTESHDDGDACKLRTKGHPSSGIAGHCHLFTNENDWQISDDRGREGHYSHQADHTAVVIMIGIKQEELQGLVWAAVRRRHLLYDGGQDSIQPPS